MTRAALFWLLFSCFAIWLLALFVSFRDLPMVDLPQHASQIWLWLQWDDPFAGDQYFEPNFRTPYLVTYSIVRLLAPVLGPLAALKAVTWLAIVGNAAALTLLVRRLGHSPWLGLLGFPTGLCHAYYFGFISFLFTTPVALCCWVLALRHGERASVKRGLALAALLCFTLLAHGIAFCIAAMGAGFLLLSGQGKLWQRLAPLLAPVLMVAVWVLPGRSTRSIGGTDWSIVWDQIFDLPASLVGMYRGDWVATIGGLLVLAVVLLHAHRANGSIWRWMPLLVTVGGYWLFPPSLFGLGWLHARFVGFIVPALLVACGPSPRWSSSPVSARLVIAVCVAWLGVFSERLWRFKGETADFHAVVEQLPAGLTVRPIVFERYSTVFPTVPALLHLPAYYQIEKGGIQGYSFAIYPVSVVRFREPWVLPVMPPGFEWHPELFDAPSEVPLYECFLVHSGSDRSQELFHDSPQPVTLAAHAGSWWAYRRE